MIKVWRYWVVRPQAPLFAAPIALLSIALLSFSSSQASSTNVGRHNVGLMLLFFLPLLWLCSRRSQRALIGKDRLRFVTEVLTALGIGLVIAAPLFWVVPVLFPEPRLALAAVVLSAVVLVSLRPILRWLFRHKKFVEQLLVLGSGEMASKFWQEMASPKGALGGWDGSRPLSIAESTNGPAKSSDTGTPVTFDELREITLRDGISRIIVAEPNVHNSKALAVAILDCKLQGLEVEQAVESYEQLNAKVWLEGIRPDWLVYTVGFRPPKFYLQLKRVLDVACGIVLLVITAPLMALTALAVRLDSRGNVLFRQERVGWHGQTFMLLKFRTMRADAEKQTGPVWASEDDPRITRLGKWLRQARLDELPQLINVVRGEMSLVGPRPERPHFVAILNHKVPYYGLRHCVKPGVTGWAQVLYPYGASVEDAYEKLQYDLYYAKHMSIAFDLRILFATIRVVAFGRGR
jgi:sugar transferase (PEP-CTERM system associated)